MNRESKKGANSSGRVDYINNNPTVTNINNNEVARIDSNNRLDDNSSGPESPAKSLYTALKESQFRALRYFPTTMTRLYHVNSTILHLATNHP